jgi:hypothetical protein
MVAMIGQASSAKWPSMGVDRRAEAQLCENIKVSRAGMLWLI